MPLDLKAIKERLAQAPAGPWRAAYDYAQTDVMGPDGEQIALVSGDPEGQHPDLRHPTADLIAHAPSDLSALVSEVESLRALLREVEWSMHSDGYDAVERPVRRHLCPVCVNFEDEGHAPDCRLAFAIREEP